MTSNEPAATSASTRRHKGDEYPFVSICDPDNECYSDCENVRRRRLQELRDSVESEELARAREQIAEARRELFKMPVSYSGDTDIVSMVLYAQAELAQRTLTLNKTEADLARVTEECKDWEERYTSLLDTNTGLRAVVEAARIYVGGLPAQGSRYDAVVHALARLDSASGQGEA